MGNLLAQRNLRNEERINNDGGLMAHRLLLRGAQIVSMDPAIGVLPQGDVLVEDGVIAAIAPQLEIEDAELVDLHGRILAPGMVDTHRHTWQTQMRGICADWTLADYYYGIRLGVSPAYTPADVYIGNKLGAIEALNAGVTTILDFSHCNNSPDHSDAAISGLLDAGIRAKFCYGFFESSPAAPPHFVDTSMRIKDFERIADAYFPSQGLVTLGVALNEIGLVSFDQTRLEIATAREHGALIATHMACVWQRPSGFDQLAEEGLLGPDQVHIHCNTLNDEQWKRLAESGAKVSISVETELNMGMGRPVFDKCEHFGVKPTLSCDVVALGSGDIATQARMGLAFKRWADTEHLNLAGRDVPRVSTSALQALEWATINGADACGLADQVGSISVGKQADLVVVGGAGLTQRPIIDGPGTLVFQTSPSDIEHVLVAGRFVKRDGRLVDHDLIKLLDDAECSSEAIRARLRASSRDLPGTPSTHFDDITDRAVANLETRH